MNGYQVALERIESALLNQATVLDLDRLNLTQIPAEIQQLTNLSVLNAGNNQISELPREIGLLKNLTALYIQNNQIRKLPNEIGQLLNLIELVVPRNEITELPKEIGQLEKLSQLNAGDNRIAELPHEIGLLNNLSMLSVPKNHIKKLPREIGQLVNLTELDISRNLIENLPNEIGHLRSLTELYAGNNQISTLPSEIGQLHNLTKLSIAGNNLTVLPGGIGQLTNLKYLYLSWNQITKIPEEIGKITSLIKLHVDDNQVAEVPPQIGRLVNLSELDVSNNQIRKLPKEMGQLKSLRHLHVSNNRITHLPAGIGLLTGLTHLNVFCNELKKLPPEMGSLVNLSVLDAGINKIAFVPKELGQLKNLTQLFISSNQIAHLPAEIGQLKNLTELYMGSNHITQLPLEIAQLKNLTELYVDDNPLTLPPKEIRDQGVEAIREYLQQMLETRERETDERPVARYEAKLVFVGWGDVGKSSLVAKLRGEELPQGGTTQGVEISPLPIFSHPDQSQHPGAEITLTAWDFGGQEIDHATHRFFLTSRSLYLVLWKPRSATEKEHVYEWLRSISLYCPGARVILVATYLKEEALNPVRLDFEKTKHDFSADLLGDARINVVDRLHHIDNVTGDGIPELWSAIQREAQHVSGLQDEWLPKWIKAEESLTGDDRHELTEPDFIEVCSSFSIEASTVRNMLGGWWHNLGKILYFPEDPELCKRVVLKPNWITKAISRVMRNPEIEKAGGVLDYRDLDAIWNIKDASGDGPYSPEYYDQFLQLMHRFGLSYELPYDYDVRSRRFLIPYLLPNGEPPEALRPPELATEVPTLTYRISIVPPGIMSRLIVALNERIHRDMRWRSGVVLERGGNFVRLQLDEEVGQKVIRLTGWGQYHPYGFFSEVRETLDSLLADYQGLELQIDVRCPTVGCKGKFSYPKLDGKWLALQRGELNAGQEMEYCEVCGKSHSIPQILYGIHPSADVLVLVKVEELLAAVREGHEENRRMLQEITRQMLRQLQAIWRHLQCQTPYLFRLMPSTCSEFHVKEQTGTTYKLELYCQWPDKVHPHGTHYDIYEPDEWLKKCGSVAMKAASVLKLFKGQVGAIKDFDGLLIDDAAQLDTVMGSSGGVRRALGGRKLGGMEGDQQKLDEAEAREFSDWLRKQGDLTYRGLREFASEEHGNIWLCPEHYAEAEKKRGSV